MLEKIPGAIGAVLSGLKAALDNTVSRADLADIPESVTLPSPGRAEWLPPDPAADHRPNDYVFRIYALQEPYPGQGAGPRRAPKIHARTCPREKHADRRLPSAMIKR